jgi:protoporphyrinogen oxidase
MKKKRVLIIGAGLSGLSLAFHLEKKGIHPIICDKASAVGGRIRTDHFNGFTLDRGFQVILSSYEEVNTLFPKNTLGEKHYFASGAFIRLNNAFVKFKNPLKNFTLFPLFASDLKKLTFFLIKNTFLFQKESSLSTKELIETLNLSNAFVKNFLHPFLSGIFLDTSLRVDSSLFLKRLKQFTFGSAYLPTKGMQTLPKALVKKLKETEILLNSHVMNLNYKTALLESGQMIGADRIVIATDAPDMKKLIGPIKIPESCSLTNLYFSLDKKVLTPEPYLYLNGEEGPINNLSFNNLIDETLSPSDKHLISVTVIDPFYRSQENLPLKVREQICRWFQIKEGLEFLRMYEIAHALPSQERREELSGYRLAKNPYVYICNELVGEASINGALKTARLVADEIYKDFMEEDPPYQAAFIPKQIQTLDFGFTKTPLFNDRGPINL